MTAVARQIARAITCDRGSDLIEYGLLTALIGILGVATWALIASKLGGAYGSYDSGTQAIWSSPDPQ